MTPALRLALLYALTAASAAASLAFITPPYRNPDELAHLERADQISRGVLLAPDVEGWPGGFVEQNLLAGHLLFRDRLASPDRRLDAASFALLRALRWSGPVPRQFINSGEEPPHAYLAAAAALALARAWNWSMLATLHLARLASAGVSLAVAAGAIALAGPAAPILFMVLALPMALAQLSAVSHDGLNIAMAALTAALFGRALARGVATRAEAIAVAIGLGLLAADRPPYVFLLLLPLALRGGWRVALGGLSIVLAWLALNWPYRTITPDGVDAGRQALRLLHHPWRAVEIAVSTLHRQGRDIADQFVGQLGWLEAPLPELFRLLAWLLLAACLAASLGWRAWPPRRQAIVVATAILLTAGGIFGAQYLSWTVVGAPEVVGVQGRYFLPLAVFVPLIFRMATGTSLGERHWRPVLAALACWMAVTLPVMLRALLIRYYS